MNKGIILEIKNNSAVIVTREGEFLTVPSESTWNIGEEVPFSLNEHVYNSSSKYSKKVFMKKGLWIALAACFMLLIMPFANITEASTYITIDINPSIELELKGNKVINIKALNSDGEKIVSTIPNDNNDLYSITENIINQAKELGYLMSNEENYIMIGLCENNTDFLIIEYEQFIEDKLSAAQLEAEILVVNGTKNDKEIADNKQVSLGKYVLQQDKKLEGIEISDEQLSKDSVKEIVNKNKELIQNKDSIQNNNSETNKNPNSTQNNNINNPNSGSNKDNKENNSNNPNNNNNQTNDSNLNNETTNNSSNSEQKNENNTNTNDNGKNNNENKNSSETIDNINNNENKGNQNTR